MRLRPALLDIAHVFALVIAVIALSVSARSLAAAQASDIPAWLMAHVGDGEGQISPVVLQRARALYRQKRAEGVVRNPCYFAMDATRPADLGGGNLGRRFYVVCEAQQSFRAYSAGHGGGRDLRGSADFANGRRCAKNFSNAMDSKLTAGGVYVTHETKTSFKGYYSGAGGQTAALIRSFVQFEGQGETANAREREIGGHAAIELKGVCLMHAPSSPYARDGYVPFGKLVDYGAGRSNGCTSWSPADAGKILATIRSDPTTLYIYPDAADINAVAHAVAGGHSLSGTGLYWNASCLREIHAPKFWPKSVLGPIISRYKEEHPAPPPMPPPMCKGS